MHLNNDNNIWSAWEPYVTGKAWTLAPGLGTKTVYVWYQDWAENPSENASNTIDETTIGGGGGEKKGKEEKRHQRNANAPCPVAFGWAQVVRPNKLIEMPTARQPRLELNRYSHSIVPGGLLVISKATRFTPDTSLMIRLLTRSNRSYGSRAQSAVIASSLVTARMTMG
jgi:hypothetical protein